MKRASTPDRGRAGPDRTSVSYDVPLFSARHLQVAMPIGGVQRTVVHDVTFDIDVGESVGLVGESGSGKSITARAILHLLKPGAAISGRLLLEGVNIAEMTRSELQSMRLHKVAMIYQDPRAHINPLRTVGDFVTEPAKRSLHMDRAMADRRAMELLGRVGIPDGARRLRQYPHQLSGGLLQRVMIAAALLGEPRLLIADEPTTALDVTTQADVIGVIDAQRHERGLAMLFITHDLELAAAITDRLVVMYAGVLVEDGPTDAVHRAAAHPYTAGLLASRPSIATKGHLLALPGRPVSAFEAGPGCVFAARCPFAEERCRAERPVLREIGDRRVACHRSEELQATTGLSSVSTP